MPVKRRRIIKKVIPDDRKPHSVYLKAKNNATQKLTSSIESQMDPLSTTDSPMKKESDKDPKNCEIQPADTENDENNEQSTSVSSFVPQIVAQVCSCVSPIKEVNDNYFMKIVNDLSFFIVGARRIM